jgi:hypothetical protein
MTDLVPSAPDAAGVDVLAYLGLDPRDVKARALVALAQRYGLDPLAGHLVLVDRKPYVTRDGLLHVAHRSGQLDGIELVAGPDLVEGEWRCTVAVYRKDMGRPFTFPGRYPAKGHRYAPEMALKVAECMALRRAFDVTGIAVLDEVDAASPRHDLERDVDVDQVDEPAHSTGVYDRTRAALGTPPRRTTPTDGQMRAINTRCREAGVRDVLHRGRVVATVLDLPEPVASLRDLTATQARTFLDRTRDVDQLVAVVDFTRDTEPDAVDVDPVEDDPAPPGPPARPRTVLDDAVTP